MSSSTETLQTTLKDNERGLYLHFELSLYFLTKFFFRASLSTQAEDQWAKHPLEGNRNYPLKSNNACPEPARPGMTDPKSVINLDCPAARTHGPLSHLFLNMNVGLFSALGRQYLRH